MAQNRHNHFDGQQNLWLYQGSCSRFVIKVVPEECVANKHESYHFANLTDILLKYADVVSVQEVLAYLRK